MRERIFQSECPFSFLATSNNQIYPVFPGGKLYTAQTNKHCHIQLSGWFSGFSHLDAGRSCGHLYNVVNQTVFEALHKGIWERPAMKPLKTLDCVFAVCDNLEKNKEKIMKYFFLFSSVLHAVHRGTQWNGYTFIITQSISWSQKFLAAWVLNQTVFSLKLDKQNLAFSYSYSQNNQLKQVHSFGHVPVTFGNADPLLVGITLLLQTYLAFGGCTDGSIAGSKRNTCSKKTKSTKNLTTLSSSATCAAQKYIHHDKCTIVEII